MPKTPVTTGKSKTVRDELSSAKAGIEDAGASTYHHGDLRNALITAGRAALDEIGARELSLRYVARTVGVSEAAPSRHFDGKEGLLAAIASQGFLELAEMRRAVAASARDTEDKVRQMMHQYVAFSRRNKGLFDLMVGPRILQPEMYAELKESSRHSFNYFASAVSEFAVESGWASSSLNLVVHAAWAVEHGLATLLLGGRAPRKDFNVKIEEMIDFTISLFISRIAAGPRCVLSKPAPKPIASRLRQPKKT